MIVSQKLKEKGLPLKATHIVMIFMTIIIMIHLLINTIQTAVDYQRLNAVTEEFIELQQAADDLMAASDYLTDKVQRFTISMDSDDMLAYFDEAENVCRRDHAIATMSEIAGGSEAFRELNTAMSESQSLMATEYSAMRMICVAKQYEDIPDAVASSDLPSDFNSLPYDEQIRMAQDYVHNDDYYASKMNIRGSMEKCTHALITSTRESQSLLSEDLRKRQILIIVLVVVQSLSMILILWLTSYLGINPILESVQRIRDNQEIPVTGSYEFRYLAKTYNKMYEAFQESIQHLNYDASHDKLTGLYNRAGYEYIRTRIDLKSTAVLMIDADKFKEINDTHGHAAGDAVLQKIASTLKHTFRHEDYICRIGGDEFIVFMLHIEEQCKDLIQLKTEIINKRLSDTSDGVPRISVSIGVAFGADSPDIDALVKCADDALYEMKSAGRSGCVFHTEWPI